MSLKKLNLYTTFMPYNMDKFTHNKFLVNFNFVLFIVNITWVWMVSIEDSQQKFIVR